MAGRFLQADNTLSRLNGPQREAVKHGGGPLLIVAGAGTGKTTTLAHRVARLIATGTDPARVLLLTFTRRAAAEMLRRVDGIIGEMADGSGASSEFDEDDEAFNVSGDPDRRLSVSRKVWGGTFHAVATRLLRRYGKSIGLSTDFTILDRGDSEDLMGVIRGDLGFGEEKKRRSSESHRSDETRFPLKGTCLSIYSRAVNTQQSLQMVLQNDFPWCIEHEDPLKQLFSAYVDRKEEASLLDYDDLLLFWRALLRDDQSGPAIRDRFDCVLVDEYQDTNVVQADILRGLSPDGEGLTVVGDDAQSIYSFRAAEVRNILDFPEQYPGTTIVKLEQNYRSSQPILDATNAVIAAAKRRHRKDLWSDRAQGEPPQMVLCTDEDEQTEFLVGQILSLRERGTPLRKQAVLFRASHHSMSLEVELGRRNIPFHKYGGLKFVETAHVKDLLAFLRLAENPRDIVSGMRVLTLLPGVGQVKARQLLLSLGDHQGDFSHWRDASPPKSAADDWPLFVALMRGLADPRAKKGSLGDQLHRVRRFYAPLLKAKYDNARERERDLEQLEVIASRFKDRMQFIAEMTLDPPSSTHDLASDPLLDEDHLVLSTIHSAKGLEWNAVYVIHATDGNIPSDLATGSTEQTEEERRLLYVALTRAKDHLYVTIPQRYYFHGWGKSDRHSYAQPSRFLTADARQQFEIRPAFAMERHDEPHVPASAQHVREGIKSMWR
ncbi:MAG: ATP-dependent helicase [Planctomycetaceae bacterium]|nr:ATP-dependent helicase [Planctomycetaceae bacterium]